MTTKENQYVYAGSQNLIDWSLSLKGEFAYTFGDNGNVLVAVGRSTPVKEFLYSYEGGTQWRRFKFSQQPLIVDAIVNEPVEFSTRFILFGTDPKTNARLLVKLDLKSHETDDQQTSDQCTEQCTFGSRTVCLHAFAKCNGKYECNDGRDEFYCPDMASKQAVTFSPNVLTWSDSNLKSLFRLNVHHTYLSQKSFNLKYSIDYFSRQGVQLNSYLIKVVRYKSQDDDSLELVQRYDVKSSEDQVDLANLEPGYSYNVQFYANLTVGDLGGIVKFNDSIVFNIVDDPRSGLYFLRIYDFKRNINYENVLIAILIALVCLVCIGMFVLIARYIKQHGMTIKQTLKQPVLSRLNYKILPTTQGKQNDYKEYLISTIDESGEQAGRVYNSPVV